MILVKNLFRSFPAFLLIILFSCENSNFEQLKIIEKPTQLLNLEGAGNEFFGDPEPLKSARLRVTNCPVEDMESCDKNGDGYCECLSSSNCDKYCQYEPMVKARVGIGGRICNIIAGCIPPVDLITLRIDFTAINPKEVMTILKNKEGKIFAKGELDSYDKKTNIASFKYHVENAELFSENLFLEIKTTYHSENGKVNDLHLQTDAFDEKTFIF